MVSLSRLTQIVGSWLIGQHSVDTRDVCDVIGAMTKFLCMALAAAAHHSTDCTRTAVDAAVRAGGCVEQNVDVAVSRSRS